MENKGTPLGTLALAEMHELDRQRGVDPFAVERASVLPQPTRVEQSLRRIEPPDWDQEHREFLARERAARVAEATTLLEEATPPPKPEPPAQKKRSWPRSS